MLQGAGLSDARAQLLKLVKIKKNRYRFIKLIFKKNGYYYCLFFFFVSVIEPNFNKGS